MVADLETNSNLTYFGCFCILLALLKLFGALVIVLSQLIILATGGEASGEISTRSKPCSFAIDKACDLSMIPS